MGFRNFVKNRVKTNTNVKSWADWSAIKESGKTIGAFVNDMRTPDLSKPAQSASFEAVVKKYNLSESDLRHQMQSRFRVALVCFILGLGALGWTVKLLVQNMITSSFVSLALGLLMFAYAFREHFHYFQIKQKRLDCTLREWFFVSFLGKSKGKSQ